jgi:hypothetical protein
MSPFLAVLVGTVMGFALGLTFAGRIQRRLLSFLDD